MRRFLMLAAIPLLIGCGAPTSLAPVSVPLEYHTMVDPVDMVSLEGCVAVSRVEVIDEREGSTLGKRFIEGQDGAAADLTTASDVATWIRVGVEDVLRKSGGSLERGGSPVLRVRINRLEMKENVYRRAGYEARISLSAELVSDSSGEVCWEEDIEEAAGNWGDAGSTENYQETVNHALDRATLKILSSKELQRSACGNCGR